MMTLDRIYHAAFTLKDAVRKTDVYKRQADILEEEQDAEEDSHSLPDSENFAASEEWAELEEQEE